LALVLEIVCRAGWVSPISLVPPSAMVVAAVAAIADPRLAAEMLRTLAEVSAAAAVAIAGGTVIGFVLGAFPRLRRLVAPILASYYAVPSFIFYPLMIVLFGIGEMPIIAIGILFSIVAMIISTLTALDRIPRVYHLQSRIDHLDPVRRMIFVLLPAAVPHLVIGARLAIAYSLIAVIAAEFILSSSGIGHQIAFDYDDFNGREMYGLILIVIAFSVFLNAVLSALTRAFAPGERVEPRHG
jgi:NitT/TauT family transport system permease protein